MDIAGRADRTQAIALARKLTSIGAFDAEDVAVGGRMLAIME